jgi:hypothetical protein
LPSDVAAARQGTEAPLDGPAALDEIVVYFKLDPALTRGLYMGERWVSPRTYTSTLQKGEQVTIHVRAEGRDARRRSTQVTPEWLPADPDMLAVSPSRGSAVTITVQRAGESRLHVTAGGVSRVLTIKATHRDEMTGVEVSD